MRLMQTGKGNKTVNESGSEYILYRDEKFRGKYRILGNTECNYMKIKVALYDSDTYASNSHDLVIVEVGVRRKGLRS